MSTPSITATTSPTNLICTNCGTQYTETCPTSICPVSTSSNTDNNTFIQAIDLHKASSPLTTCRMCDDPRGFVPPEGQTFSTLERLWESGRYENKVERSTGDEKVWEIWTERKFGIGQRALLLQTPYGNVLWDIVAYLDQATVDKINELGGIKLIVISHPHFYTTWADWSTTFNCPVYLSDRDARDWANRTTDPKAQLRLLTDQHTELLPGLTAVIAGGHFPGSMLLHAAPPNVTVPTLFTADTILNVPSARNPDPAKPGVNSYTFMWSYPGLIPLGPDDILAIWRAIKPYDFVATYGLMKDVHEVRERPGQRMSLKQRVLESAKIHCRHEGYADHAIFEETC